MTFSLPGLIFVWTLALWALGWLVLPLSRRLFVNLPDGGLAAGRIGFVILVALVAFWGASFRVVPLRLAPAIAVGCALGCALGWRDLKTRIWARENWRALAVSDAVFGASWALFVWIRLRHPEINDLEKMMDAALLSAAWKAEWLPFAHPWFGGAQFTNYYYFGPLMGALMGRALGTAPHLAYNLVQPAFCAFFLSTLWGLGTALTRSKWWGLAVVALVGMGGPLEPLRQIAQGGWSWPLDWWKTARVIENTINEYPAFTMITGDAHAHFYALSLAVLWLCLAWSLFAPSQTPTSERANIKKSRKKKGKKQREAASTEAVWGAQKPRTPRRLIVVVGGLVLGAWLMTNTWDAPVFALLFGLAIWLTRPANQPRARVGLAMAAPLVIAVGASALYFRSFRSPLVSDAVFVGPVRLPQIAAWQPWLPDGFSFALLWGGWLTLGALAFLLPATADARQTDARQSDARQSDGSTDERARFRRLLIGVGLLALVAPYLFYIRGAFGDGQYRHQDTVFKFGLQAWVLLGVGVSTELGARFMARKKTPKLVVALALLLVAPALALAPATTLWTRAEIGQTREISLDGTRYLPPAQQRALAWLQTNGRAGEVAMEPVPLNPDGLPGGDYDGNWGIVGAFSGVSSTLGWPQHVWGWDGNYGEVVARGRQIAALYVLPSALETARGSEQWNARYVFFGMGNWQTPDETQARAAGWKVHEFNGQDGSRALILERIER